MSADCGPSAITQCTTEEAVALVLVPMKDLCRDYHSDCTEGEFFFLA